MAARARKQAQASAKGPVERLHERIVAGDRGWFFSQIAGRVTEERMAKGLSQRELALRETLRHSLLGDPLGDLGEEPAAVAGDDPLVQPLDRPLFLGTRSGRHG